MARTHHVKARRVGKKGEYALNCLTCGKPIEYGQPYQYFTMKLSYGGVKKSYHVGCEIPQSHRTTSRMGEIYDAQTDAQCAIRRTTRRREFKMGLIPDTAFTVRKPAWWDETGQFDLDYYPGREEAMRLAGHDGMWSRCRCSPASRSRSARRWAWSRTRRTACSARSRDVNHVRSDNGVTLAIHSASYERIPNSVAYDVAEAVLEGTGWKYQCGISMDEGRQNALTLVLDEPIQITGDRALIFPLVALSWAHDGSGSLKLRSTSIRNECQNTVSASEAEAKAAGTDFTFRHTKNVMERIEEAKKAIRGVGPQYDVFREKMEELAAIPVTPEQRDLFVSTIIGDRDGVALKSNAATSSRVKTNLETERAKINALFFGHDDPGGARAHGYGLHLAGVEYFDHLRAFRSKDSYVKRTLLTDNPAKANLARTIREVVAA
jgi:phage/plasmid-like protein (TIGR03299 family)